MQSSNTHSKKKWGLGFEIKLYPVAMDVQKIVKPKILKGNLAGVVANVLDCDIVVTEFEVESRCYVHFQINILAECMNSFQSMYGLNSTTTIILLGWLWHYITRKGWYAIKQETITYQTSKNLSGWFYSFFSMSDITSYGNIPHNSHITQKKTYVWVPLNLINSIVLNTCSEEDRNRETLFYK